MSDYPKKLIEVALPLEDINAASAKEKSIRRGHPSTLHLWWARRPLATARAVLFGQLVDDPSGYVEELWEDKNAIKKAENVLGRKIKPGTRDENLDKVLIEQERERLFNLIRKLVLWENTNNEAVLEPCREEIRKSWRRTCRLGGNPEDTPLPPFLDPFAGGGAIPLEAQRLGLEAHASDLNPVAVLINKATIEIPPKFANQPPVNPNWQAKSKEEKAATTWAGAQGLAEDVRYYGEWMHSEAFKRIDSLYPPYTLTQKLINSRPDLKNAGYKDGDELTVIAWLWARTVPSPNPALKGKHVPLVSSFWLSKKKGKEVFVEPIVSDGDYRFEIRVGKPAGGQLPVEETINRKGGLCLLSDVPIPFPHIRSLGQKGQMSVRLMAVVCGGKKGRVYLPATDRQVVASSEATPSWSPPNKLPHNPRDFKTPNYGMETFADLFTDRQLVALNAFCDLVAESRKKVITDAQSAAHLPKDLNPLEQSGYGPTAYADAVAVYLAFGVSKLSDYLSNLVRWKASMNQAIGTFSMQALPMRWDFAESNPFAGMAGDYTVAINTQAKALERLSSRLSGFVQQADAASRPIPKDAIISTDPPYYDNIGYADLSDFFYVWLRRALQCVSIPFFGTMLVPKEEELIAAPYRHGGKESADQFFLNGMIQVATKLAKASNEAIPTTIYYAFKQAEIKEEGLVSTGWATFLEALIKAGFTIDGTWPMRTEMANKISGAGSNMLASSIILVCRLRIPDAPLATRKEFVQTMQRELPTALHNLQQGNIAPVDLPQSSIGPGMAIFSRYSKVVEADGSSMPVWTALQLINQAVDEFLSKQEAQMDEWTRFAVTWFSQNGFKAGSYGDAETIAVAKGVAVDGVADAGIIESGGGKVRILSINELPEDWNPATDTRLTIWELVHHLAHRLDQKGTEEAAALIRQVGGLAEDAKSLCYRLYNICEQNKWAEEAAVYNSLITEWPEISKLAATMEETTQANQQELI